MPLTVRAVALLSLATLAIRYFAVPENDLVASIVGGAAVGLAVFLLVFAFAHRLKTGRALRAECHFDHFNAFTGRQIPAGIVLQGSDVWPFFFLTVTRQFEHQGFQSPVHIIRGQEFKDIRRHIIDAVSFPHRGMWVLPYLEVSLSDIFGLTKFSWRLPLDTAVEVSPELLPIRPLPIVASSSRPGDELNFARERTGDPFDIKPYDPSDGISRILWKQYAKHGELVVRRPEPALIPEGEVAVYLIANREEDYVAAAAKNYIQQLSAQDITVLFGTDALSGPTAAFTSNVEDISHSINQNVWADFVGTGSGFRRYVDSLLEASFMLHQIIVFGPERSDWFEYVAPVLEQHGIKLVFGFVPASLASAPSRKQFTTPVSVAVSRSGGEVIECEAAVG